MDYGCEDFCVRYLSRFLLQKIYLEGVATDSYYRQAWGHLRPSWYGRRWEGAYWSTFYPCALLCSSCGRRVHLHGGRRESTQDLYHESYFKDANLRPCERFVRAESLPTVHDLHVHEPKPLQKAKIPPTWWRSTFPSIPYMRRWKHSACAYLVGITWPVLCLSTTAMSSQTRNESYSGCIELPSRTTLHWLHLFACTISLQVMLGNTGWSMIWPICWRILRQRILVQKLWDSSTTGSPMSTIWFLTWSWRMTSRSGF